MKTMPLTEARTNFSSVIKDVELGNEIAISFRKSRETVAVIVPYEEWKRTRKRELGTLRKKGSVMFAADGLVKQYAKEGLKVEF